MNNLIIPAERIEARIFILRGEKVILDFHLATLYEVTTKTFNQAVSRNAERFPADFKFKLNRDEVLALRALNFPELNSRGLISPPSAFTEQGIAMLASVLNSPKAIAVHIEIIRAFVRLRQMIASNVELSRKLANLEKKYDAQFKAVFDAIRALMDDTTVVPPSREIGFHSALAPLAPAKPKPTKPAAKAPRTACAST
jgi:ORF6N domain